MTEGADTTDGGLQVDYRQINKKETVKSDFPAEMIDEYRVYIDPDAYERMQTHAALSDEVELCGVLVGKVCSDLRGCYLRVDAVIEGEGANMHGAQVTFTHQTWSHINRVMDERYPDKQIVGWYHTHPGFGVFLSGMDMFIQENFFNQPYHVAIVIETKENVEGCFIWVEGKAHPLQRYWVGTREIKLCDGPVEAFKAEMLHQSATSGDPTRQVPVAQAPPLTLSIMLMMGLVGLFGFLLGRMMVMGDMQTIASNAVHSEMYSLLETVMLSSAAVEDLQFVRKQLAEVEKELASNPDDAGQMIKAMDQTLAMMGKTYQTQRDSLRKAMWALQAKRVSMGESIRRLENENEQLKHAVGSLLFLRISEVLTRFNPSEIELLPEMERRNLRLLIERAIRLNIANKALLTEQFPDAINTLFPPTNHQEGEGRVDAPPKRNEP